MYSFEKKIRPYIFAKLSEKMLKKFPQSPFVSWAGTRTLGCTLEYFFGKSTFYNLQSRTTKPGIGHPRTFQTGHLTPSRQICALLWLFFVDMALGPTCQAPHQLTHLLSHSTHLWQPPYLRLPCLSGLPPTPFSTR
jgi:hypothetical protein